MKRIPLDDLKQLGPLIRKARTSQKISRDDLANFTGLHRNGIAKIENGTSDVRLSSLLKITQLLRIRVVLEVDAED